MSETITSPTGAVLRRQAVMLTTPESDRSIKPVPVHRWPEIVGFFIGGASDKRPFLGQGPYRNITHVLDRFDQEFKSEISKGAIGEVSDGTKYLGYYEVFEDANIKEHVLSQLPSKQTSILIIGHSLGGWNAAHLSRQLSLNGYNVMLLITLDPVGERHDDLLRGADIYKTVPRPVCDYWINLRYDGHTEEWFPNEVARLGGQWKITGTGKSAVADAQTPRLPDINETVAVNHANTLRAMFTPLKGGGTAWSIMKNKIDEKLR